MIWPIRRKSKKSMARIVIDEPITSSTRVSVLKALKQIEDREFPALIVRIDSPGGTVGGSQSNKRINSEYIQNLVKETLWIKELPRLCRQF